MSRPLLVLDKGGHLALKTGGKLSPAQPITDNIVLLVDTSASMEGEKIEQVKTGAAQFATGAAAHGFGSGILLFADRAAVALAPTSDLATIVRKLQALQVGLVGNSTNLAAGLQVCLRVPRLHAVVVVTDGMPNDRNAALAAADNLKRLGVEILIVGTDDADRAFLRRLASRPDLALKTDTTMLRATLADSVHLLLTAAAQ